MTDVVQKAATDAPERRAEPRVGRALARHAERFLDHLAVERGVAPNTVVAYKRDLRLYLAPDGSFSFKFRSTDLDALVPADPAATAYTDAARQEFNRLRNR